MRRHEASGDCSVAHALGVVGDGWTLLIVRDVAGGVHRFDALQAELGISRKVLTERLTALVEDGVLERRPYREHPPRFDYHLTQRGLGLMPTLIALQDWGARHVQGDGSLTATTTPGTDEEHRVRGLVGQVVPRVELPDRTGALVDPVAPGSWTVLYCYPGAHARPEDYPAGWAEIPGARGCTLESRTFRDRLADFTTRGATVRGVSTQPYDQLDGFAAKEDIRFPLLSDVELGLAAALRLPTFRAGGADHLKRLSLVVDRDRVIRGVLYPIVDPARSVDDALAVLDRESAR